MALLIDINLTKLLSWIILYILRRSICTKACDINVTSTISNRLLQGFQLMRQSHLLPMNALPKETQITKQFCCGHTQTLYSGLREELPNNIDILQITSSGCGASLSGQQSNDNFCAQSNWFAYNTIKKTKPDVVLIAQGTGHDLQSMLQISDTLKSDGVKKVIFVGPAPHWLKPLPNIVALKLWENTPAFSKYALDQKYNELDKKLNSLFPKSSERTYVSLIDSLCNSNGCSVFIGDDKKLGITSWDQGHITPIASQKFAKEVLAPEIMREN